MINLSVNINKLATLRNARGHDNPNLIDFAKKIEQYGAQGITVHPRPDERHVRYADVHELKKVVKGEFNIEGNCREEKFVKLVLDVLPDQVTLVPDAEGQLTSNHGWDTITHQSYLADVICLFKEKGIRVSIFVDPDVEKIKAAKTTGTDRIELYTESYASKFVKGNKQEAIQDFIKAAETAYACKLGINAGHDLDLQNLPYFAATVPNLQEVSIGHALICDALEYGMENAVQLYKRCLNPSYFKQFGV